MRTPHEEVLDDLDALVAGDRAAIARHADHLASCDSCRDAKHDAAQLADKMSLAGADFVESGDLVGKLMAKLDDAPKPEVVEAKPAVEEKKTPVVAKKEPVVETSTPVIEMKRTETPVAKPAARPSKRLVYMAGAMAAMAAGTIGLVALKKSGNGHDVASTSPAIPHGAIGTIKTISRAAAQQGDGVAISEHGTWRALAQGETIPAGATLRTDERTRVSIDMADGSRLVLDHRTQLSFDASEPRHIHLELGRIATDVAHVDNRPASFTTPTGHIDVIGTRLSVTANDKVTAVQVVRGAVALSDKSGHKEEIRAGEEGVLENGAINVSSAPSLVKENTWSELAPPTKPDDDQATAGLGALRAYKPGEKRDRDWKLALADHEVKVRISGPVARTEVTEVFRNDSDTQLEGVYQFPLPADAQIDSLQLDVANQPGQFIAGAFVDKERATKIWKGVIDKATPRIERDPLIQQEIVWVPGPWKDPALLDWKRGGRFELKIFPIPAKGQRTIKLSYTQVVSPRGTSRQYVYPLPHSTDGSTVADKFKIDVEVRGAQQGSVHPAGYDLVADGSRADVGGMTLDQGGFVPRGDLVVDYRVDNPAELRAWTFTGGAAAGPDDKLAAKKNVGIDPKVIDAQRVVAADARPTAVLALSPKLPRWRESKDRDYVIVIDGSQSMVGERFTRAGELATAMVDDMDRRDRFSVLVCDSDCRRSGDLRAPSTAAAGELKTWLAAQQPAGASDVVTAIRAGNDELSKPDSAQRERWVIYVGDGFATTGFRRVSDVEAAIGSTMHASTVHVSTVGIGTDADSTLLAAAARGGGGSYLAWVPGLTVGTAAMAALESSYGTSLRDATIELPAGLSEVAAAGGAAGATPTTTMLPTLRAGGEVLIAARMGADVNGEVVLRGKVAGQPFEQRYPLKLAVSSAPGNGFVPRLWASLAIDELERQGKGEDRARIVALSQGYGVMSRQTSLLVLESQAMFDAFGVDRSQSSATWSGEEDLDEVATSGTMDVPADNATAPTGGAVGHASRAPSRKMDLDGGGDDMYSARDAGGLDGGGGGFGGGFSGGKGAVAQSEPAMDKTEKRAEPKPASRPVAVPPPAPAAQTAQPMPPPPPPPPQFGGRRVMVAMKKVYDRHAALGNYTGVDASITKAIADAQDVLAKNPDSREKHRALVQALSYAGELDKAHDVAVRWLERDKLDPQALGYIADLMGRDGKRDLALRTLGGLVDLEPDRAALHERMINAYERAGHMSQACSHRIALVSLSTKEAAPRAGAAARCLRTLGRTSDADLVIKSLVDDKARTEAEKAATVAPVASRVTGDLVLDGHWDQAADLDISLIAPDGSRVSWMGGRTDITVGDSTSQNREQLAIKRLRRGNYLVEITRSEPTSSPIHGTVDVSALGIKQAFPFELTGTRQVVGRVSVTVTSHLEPVNPSDARFLGGQQWNRPMPGRPMPFDR